jgi:hypothetical protein
MGFLSASQQVEGIESSANRECQTPARTHIAAMPDAVPLRITARLLDALQSGNNILD